MADEYVQYKAVSLVLQAGLTGYRFLELPALAKFCHLRNKFSHTRGELRKIQAMTRLWAWKNSGKEQDACHESIWGENWASNAQTCGVGVAALYKLELPGGVDDKVLRPSGEVSHVHCREVQGIQNKVPITDRIHAVGTDASNEAQLLCNLPPVYPERISRQGTCARGGLCSRSNAGTSWWTQHGTPSSLPEPRGRVATRGIRSLSRWSSRCQAAAWESSQWPHRTV